MSNTNEANFQSYCVCINILNKECIFWGKRKSPIPNLKTWNTYYYLFWSITIPIFSNALQWKQLLFKTRVIWTVELWVWQERLRVRIEWETEVESSYIYSLIARMARVGKNVSEWSQESKAAFKALFYGCQRPKILCLLPLLSVHTVMELDGIWGS